MTAIPKPRTAEADHFASIQLLRFIAAMLVVLMHTTEAMTQRIAAFHDIRVWTPGGAGVDIFFVISGFVMAISSRPPSLIAAINIENAVDFCKRRMLRVVPLYWFYSILKILSVLALPALALRTVLTPEHIMASFLFLPWTSPWGLIQPILPVGWTLNYEILFYLIFAIAIALNANRLLFCVSIFLVLHLAGRFHPDVTAFAFYGRTLVFEFGIGLLLAQLRHRRLSALAALLLVALGLTLLGYESIRIDRLFHQGLGAGLLVYGCIQLEQQARIRTALEKITVLGDISYSTYLCHSFLVPVSVALFATLQMESAYGVIVITLLIVVAGSVASYLWIERPLTASLKRMLFKPSQAQTSPVSAPIAHP